MRNKAHRALEKQEKQYHVSLTDRSVEATTAPPFTIVVVGPAGVGKTTIIQSLVKHWTKQVTRACHVAGGRLLRRLHPRCARLFEGVDACAHLPFCWLRQCTTCSVR